MWTETASAGAAATTDDRDRISPCNDRTRFSAGTVARIFRRTRSPLTAGRADTKCWRLTFRGTGRRFIEPVMGWVGTDDPLAGLEQRFPTLESAVRYARRQALDFTVVDAPLSGNQTSAPAVHQRRAA